MQFKIPSTITIRITVIILAIRLLLYFLCLYLVLGSAGEMSRDTFTYYMTKFNLVTLSEEHFGNSLHASEVNMAHDKTILFLGT